MLNTLYNLPFPTIAAVNGAAYGGGVGLVTACDIAVANKYAKFCLSEARLGLIPSVISPYVVKWDGTNWHGLAGGAPALVVDMEVFKGNLYICGSYFNDFFLKLK